ncbi:MAG: hypothetical protein KAY32_15275 [Candidatus Eisenbacteria sp.]|nr:hypothetical protein [Candidatus Eisenbacteria bacterium]
MYPFPPMVQVPRIEKFAKLFVSVLLFAALAPGSLPGAATDVAQAQPAGEMRETEEGPACDALVQQAMEHLISDRYREALSYVERAFGIPQATPQCQAHCLQTQSCTYLRMGERARAVQALTELLNLDPNPPYDGRMFPPAMNRLFRAVRDSLAQAGTMDIGTVAIINFSVLNPGKFRYQDYDYDALGQALQMIVTTDIIEGTNLTVVDRTNMRDVLAELELTSNSELVNQQNRVRLGQLLNAHAFVAGQIAIFEKKKIRIDIQIIHAATTRVLSRQYEGPFSGDTFELLRLQRGVLAMIVEALNEFRKEVKGLELIAPDPVYFDRLEETRRESKATMEAWLLQGQALEREDAGDLKGAIKIWEQVQKVDPQNELARGRIWALKAELEE